MAQYSTVNLARNDLISYIVFSCWDNTAGPTAKRLWAGSPIPDHSEIKLLTRLVLKTEVPHRDHKSAHIDCNVYNLADLGVCAVSYLFTGVAKSRIGSRIFCLILVCRADHRARYMQWSSIIDPVVKQDIAEYKVKLHQVSDWFDQKQTTASSRLGHSLAMFTGTHDLKPSAHVVRLFLVSKELLLRCFCFVIFGTF